MKVEVLYFEGCPNYAPALELVKGTVSDMNLAVDVNSVKIRDVDDARRLRFLGSPSIHVNGVDVDPSARDRTDFAFGCRRYGDSGTPSRTMIENALRERSSV